MSTVARKMMEAHDRQEPVRLNTRASRTLCALHTVLYSFLPLLFFTALIIAGTIFLSYSLFLQQPVPRQFMVVITITFAALISMAVALHIAKALRDKRAHGAKDDIEQRLLEYYGPLWAPRFAYMFPSDVEKEPYIENLPRPPTVYLPDRLGTTIDADQINPDLVQPADNGTREVLGPPANKSTPEYGGQRDGLGIPAGLSATIK